MKLNKYKCDRCGKVFNEKTELIGNSERCVERVWDICGNCFTEFHIWMENKK